MGRRPIGPTTATASASTRTNRFALTGDWKRFARKRDDGSIEVGDLQSAAVAWKFRPETRPGRAESARTAAPWPGRGMAQTIFLLDASTGS